jgi:hypothetical protein
MSPFQGQRARSVRTEAIEKVASQERGQRSELRNETFY